MTSASSLFANHQNKAVLVALKNWNALQETLHILQVPGMREDLLEGMRTPVEECVTKEKLDC